MSTQQPIQFLLFQIENHAQDRTNVEAIWKQRELNRSLTKFRSYLYDGFELENYLIEIFIRTCLSRINNNAVLEVLNKTAITYDFEGSKGIDCYRSVVLYEYFDYELRMGKPLDTAIQALHEKMLELVPEYREFLNDEK